MFKFLLIILSLAPTLAFAKIEVTDGVVPGAPKELKFELVVDTESSSRDLIYWFHGSGGDEKGAQIVAAKLSETWDKQGVAHPRVLGISFGPQWVAISKNSSPESGLLDYILQEAIPYLEKNIVKTPVAVRSLIGHSMGGFNGLQAATECPRIFERVVLTSAGFVLLSPFSTDDQIRAYLKKYDPKSDPEKSLNGLKGLFAWESRLAPSPAEWEVADPETRVKDLSTKCSKSKSAENPKAFYISAGIQDTSFFPGNRKIAGQLKKAGETVQWQKLLGGHNDRNYEAIAKFLDSGINDSKSSHTD